MSFYAASNLNHSDSLFCHALAEHIQLRGSCVSPFPDEAAKMMWQEYRQHHSSHVQRKPHCRDCDLVHDLPTIPLINRQLRQVLPSKSRTNMNSTCTSLDNNRLQSRRAPKQAIDPCGHILAHATMYGNTYRLSKRAS